MSARLVCMVAALALCTAAPAGEKPTTAPWDGGPKPLRGDYQVYGGTLAELAPPTKKDRKVAFMFTGPLAKDLFGQIGPDLKDACGAGPDHRTRYRGDLSCVWTKEDGYACYFGLDVPTGKSTNGSIC
jgi:hypothetical protein